MGKDMLEALKRIGSIEDNSPPVPSMHLRSRMKPRTALASGTEAATY
jgi:hypothetical protein